MSNIKKFDRDSDGFLNDPQDWDIKFVETVSSEFNIELKDNHWEIINYVREYFEKHHKVPELRELLKSFRIKFGENKATRKYIYNLFPYGYGQQACKLAGMRQPKKLWLDL
jgi:tRNA 2-thiouridine synthesizing protein E